MTMDHGGSIAVDAALDVAAAHGLTTTHEQVSVGDRDIGPLRDAARFDGLCGLLATAVIDERVVVPADQRQHLMADWYAALDGCVLVEAQAVRTAAMLDGAGIRWRLTKGPAIAHLDFPDPALRTFGDVDLLVYPDDWLTAAHLLIGGGMTREGDVPLAALQRSGKGVTLLSPDGFEIDLHRRFAVGRFGLTSRTEDCFAAPPPTIILAGAFIPVLDPAMRLLHAAYHAILGGFSGRRVLRDIAQLILITGVDPDDAFEVATSWRCEAVLAAGIRRTWASMGLAGDHPALAAAMNVRSRPLDAATLAVFARHHGFRRQALTGLTVIGPWRWPSYLADLRGRRR